MSRSSSSINGTPFAALRRDPRHDEFARLADEHMKHDLEQSDRDCLYKAASRVSVPATLGTLVGLGLGLYAAVRLRRARADVFRAFRAAERPTHVVFAGGGKNPFAMDISTNAHTEPVPDITPFIQPSRFGDYATYFFFGLGGTILGGELGFLLGSWSAARLISKDPARKGRVENAYRKFRADLLKREANQLEAGGPVF
ncbi:hypothetical protein PG994_005201 [Apiospora phragmitis]|uniref:Uncharacterized protein n=1 Tax=Apiospora phragmitis TaxID=2905665 RepID=A0ABR1VU02_9PEZI